LIDYNTIFKNLSTVKNTVKNMDTYIIPQMA